MPHPPPPPPPSLSSPWMRMGVAGRSEVGGGAAICGRMSHGGRTLPRVSHSLFPPAISLAALAPPPPPSPPALPATTQRARDDLCCSLYPPRRLVGAHSGITSPPTHTAIGVPLDRLRHSLSLFPAVVPCCISIKIIRPCPRLIPSLI
jgi:hypothetical protein